MPRVIHFEIQGTDPEAQPRMPVPGVGWFACVRDPDGNILGLMLPDPGAR
jgi:hypothetical protein